jgi:hypothetical protein
MNPVTKSGRLRNEVCVVVASITGSLGSAVAAPLESVMVLVVGLSGCAAGGGDAAVGTLVSPACAAAREE